MLLKNNSKGARQFSINRLPENATIPVSEFIQLPPKATIEIEDKHWKQITSAMTRVQIYETSLEPIGTEEFGQAKIGKEKLFKTVKIPTGKYHTVNLVLEMVKNGELEVVEAPAIGLSVEQLVARINLVKGMTVDGEDFSQEELEDIYFQNQAKIEAAMKVRKATKE